MPINGLGQAAIPMVGYNYRAKQMKRVQETWNVLLPTGIMLAVCGTLVFWLFPGPLLSLFSVASDMLRLGIPALRIISLTFAQAAVSMLCGYFASGFGNGVINMLSAAIRQFSLQVLCPIFLIRTAGIGYGWYAFWQ